MIRVFVTLDRAESGTVLPVRFVDPDVHLDVDVDIWKTNSAYLTQPHVFVLTNAPVIQGRVGYVDFEGIAFPPLLADKHASRVFRYFVGRQHFDDGSVYEL